jgi:hypothetical protein
MTIVKSHDLIIIQILKRGNTNMTYHWYGKELNNIITKRITVTNKIIIIDNPITWLCTL